LRGWRCRATATRRGTLVYLHGIADNRTSAAGVVARFAPRGFDVVAFDSRANGESDGDICTYGFFEKEDLRRIIDTIPPGPIVLLGTSLGAAIALQEAAHDPRVSAIVAAETFSDLRTVATERAPAFFTKGIIRRAFQLAEEQGHFNVDAVSPQDAAASITAPVLLIHGAADVDTRPAHSERVFAALKGPKRLILVPGAAHNGSLTADSWTAIEQWIDQVIPVRILAAPGR
jgi:pimeloyl-ACP methyl ester carboxylesterase